MFYSLWLVLILGIGLWRLQSRPRPDPLKKGPELIISKEISGWFLPQTSIEAKPSRFVISLKTSPAYLSKLGGKEREFQIGYQFLGGTTVLASGNVPCRMKPEVELILPNEKRISPRRIRLYLAH